MIYKARSSNKDKMIFHIISLVFILLHHVLNVAATKCPLVELSATAGEYAGRYKVAEELEVSWAPDTPVYRKPDGDR